MANPSDQLEEIKALISSGERANKVFAYSTLLHFKEQSSDCPVSIQALAGHCRTLLSLLLADISVDDEEISAQALKCLGFMIYHPSLVSAIDADDAGSILESLVKLITTTKMKSVCNLGVWCISVQQLNSALLDVHYNSLLQAVVHALDNPFGSLSITFEAIQAVTKLSTELSEKMRDLSHIWAPPIYRRIISFDKRERDMSERCMLKIKSTILPPPLLLSKALVQDMKQRLLTKMKEMLNQGMKVQATHAWGWFIRLLGSYAMKNRSLINEMLKIPEQTFSDLNPQVQIASQVAWEGLIDALIHPPLKAPLKACEMNTAMEENGVHQTQTSGRNSGEIHANGFSKSIKLVMTPLIGTMTSKCDICVQLSSLNTWCYLLHKLDASVNDPSVIKLVLEPIFEAVFLMGPSSKSMRLWNLCLDLLDDFILAKCGDLEYDAGNLASQNLSVRTSILGPSILRQFPWKKEYSVKWLSWDICHLDFHFKMICILINQALIATISPENRSLSCSAASRLFTSVLKAVQLELRKPSTNYNQIMVCLGAVLRFIKKICEDVISEGIDSNDLHLTILQFIEAVTKELEPAILGCPLYKVPLDLKYIDNLQSVNTARHAKVLHTCSIAYMNMVSPVVYLVAVYFSLVFQLTMKSSNAEFILQGIHKYFEFLFSIYDPVETLAATISLLYNCVSPNCLKIWIAITRGLKDSMVDVKELLLLRTSSDSDSYLAIFYLLSYPFSVFSCPGKNSKSLTSCSLEKPYVSTRRNLELEHVNEVWKSLYGSLESSLNQCSAMNSLHEDLCSMLNDSLGEYSSMLECTNDGALRYKELVLDHLSLSGNAMICLLEEICTSEVSMDDRRCKHCGDYKVSCRMNSRLRLASRYLKLLLTIMATDPPSDLLVTSSVFSTLARVVSCLHVKQDILLFIEVISCPLLQWLSLIEILDQNTKFQLQLMWSEVLSCLRSSLPPIIFDSAFLKLQAPLLEGTLDHPNPSISEPTIAFWNSTYGEQTKLDYPQCLLHVLDKLSRLGRINLHRRSLSFLKRCHQRVGDDTAPQRYRVTTGKNNKSSKRVELMVDHTVNQLQHEREAVFSFKKKKVGVN